MSTITLCDMSLEEAEKDHAHACARGDLTIAGGLVVNLSGQIFAQRRSKTRSFGPGWWENVGGKVDPGETLAIALPREIAEETGWHLKSINRCVAIRTYPGRDNIPCVEYIFLCTVDGDLSAPTLESGLVDATAWIDTDNLALVDENRSAETSQSQIYTHALTFIHV